MTIRTQKEYDKAKSDLLDVRKRIKLIRGGKSGYRENDDRCELERLEAIERELRHAIARVELKVERKFF